MQLRRPAHEAAALLQSNEPFVSVAIKHGLLMTNGSQRWKLDRATVLRFRDQYVLTAEIAHRLGCRYRDVRTLMAARGVAPAGDKHLVWDREKVERAIEGILDGDEQRIIR